MSDYLIKRRDEGKYEVDGIVVIDSSQEYDVSNTNPDYGFAFKQVLTDQIAEVTVLDVLWSPSMDGYLKPRIKINKISLGGVEINYATAFNGKFVVDNKIGPGSVIKLVRSGDVIPHILEVLEPSSNGQPKIPDTPHKWNNTKVDFVVISDDKNSIIKVKQLRHFFFPEKKFWFHRKRKKISGSRNVEKSVLRFLGQLGEPGSSSFSI